MEKHHKFDWFLQKFGKGIASVFAVTGLVVMLFFLLISPFNDWSWESSPELFGQYGDFIGGVAGTLFALAGFILLYQTLQAQQKALDTQEKELATQKREAEKQSFENTFFNLLDAQQNITNQIKVTVPVLTDYKYVGETKKYEGRAFFQFAKQELTYIFDALNQPEYLSRFDTSMGEMEDQTIEVVYNPEVNGPYLELGAEYLQYERIRQRSIQFALDIYNINYTRWGSLRTHNQKVQVQKVFSLFFQKYHYAFGHYFRHLYNIIKFVRQYQDTQKQALTQEARDLFVKDTNRYVQLIQAQMSSYELMLLYYNAFCFERSYELLVHYKFLENLAEEDLVYPSHNFKGPLHLQKRADLLNGV